MVVPFGADDLPVAFDRIAVDECLSGFAVFEVALPDVAVGVLQGDFAFSEQQHDLLAPLGVVVDFESQSHRSSGSSIWGGSVPTKLKKMSDP